MMYRYSQRITQIIYKKLNVQLKITSKKKSIPAHFASFHQSLLCKWQVLEPQTLAPYIFHKAGKQSRRFVRFIFCYPTTAQIGRSRLDVSPHVPSQSACATLVNETQSSELESACCTLTGTAGRRCFTCKRQTLTKRRHNQKLPKKMLQ